MARHRQLYKNDGERQLQNQSGEYSSPGYAPAVFAQQPGKTDEYEQTGGALQDRHVLLASQFRGRLEGDGCLPVGGRQLPADKFR